MGRKHTDETKQKIKDTWHNTHPPLSEETKAKMSEAHRGKKRSEDFCKKLSERTTGKQYALGRKHTEDEKRRIGASQKGKAVSEDVKQKLRDAWARNRENRIGYKAPSWKGGVTPEHINIRNSVEMERWRISVFERDDWRCQECGKRGNGELHAHHIQSFSEYPQLRFVLDNGITVCRDCHMKIHRNSYEAHKINPLPVSTRPTSENSWMGL